MNVVYSTIIFTIINFVLLFAIIIAIYKGIQTVKLFVNRNKRMDEKLDIILNKLENKEVKQDNWLIINSNNYPGAWPLTI